MDRRFMSESGADWPTFDSPGFIYSGPTNLSTYQPDNEYGAVKKVSAAQAQTQQIPSRIGINPGNLGWETFRHLPQNQMPSAPNFQTSGQNTQRKSPQSTPIALAGSLMDQVPVENTHYTISQDQISDVPLESLQMVTSTDHVMEADTPLNSSISPGNIPGRLIGEAQAPQLTPQLFRPVDPDSAYPPSHTIQAVQREMRPRAEARLANERIPIKYQLPRERQIDQEQRMRMQGLQVQPRSRNKQRQVPVGVQAQSQRLYGKDVADSAGSVATTSGQRGNLGDVGSYQLESGINFTNLPHLDDHETPSAQDILRVLTERIQFLQFELENERERPQAPSPSADVVSPKIQVFHCLPGYESEDEVHLSPPVWDVHGTDFELRGSFRIADPDAFMERTNDVSFAIYMHYRSEFQMREVTECIRRGDPLPTVKPETYEVVLVSEQMTMAVTAWFDNIPNFRKDFSDIRVDEPLMGPFIWYFHHRKSLKTIKIDSTQAELIATLAQWIEETFGDVYNRVEDQFSRGKVNDESMEFLIKPGTVLVQYEQNIPVGWAAMSIPSMDERSKIDQVDGIGKVGGHRSVWSIKARSISYCGGFRRTIEHKTITLETGSLENGVDIASLEVAPMDYCDPKVRSTLACRGDIYWKCRDRQFVAYDGHTTEGQRFMVDFDTYKSLHPENKYSDRAGFKSTLSGPEANLQVDVNDLPAPERFLFPAFIAGFDFRRKKWCEIEVDRISEVEWDDQAFEHLVADEDVKELIEALVSNQMATEASTDLIKNKGNGLIMLLHGSPGTGKTFTAESVAELARKPLYPVTCGDIGTEPEKVEKYLESIFYLAKKWNCVLLLDEAEVFLEQRTLQDLHRNALVSVFLRALEYYDGILILTTNRVGTFDEAFKSRIQISLPYKRLNVAQRKQIWKNFLNRLQSLEQHDSIDFDDLDAHIDELAAYSMNGRQIRNSITTARQLADFKKKKAGSKNVRMNFASLKKTIMVAEKFEKYLADVREGDVQEFEGRAQDEKHSDELEARLNTLR